MTATEPQTAGPKGKRPSRDRSSVWIVLAFSLLAVAGYFWVFGDFPRFISSAFGICVLAAFAASLAALIVFPHRPAEILLGDEISPWYCDGIWGVFWVAMGIAMIGVATVRHSSPLSWAGYFVFAGACLATMLLKFFRARQQFTLRTLMLVTLGVAILCSTSRYVPIVDLLVFLILPAWVWARLWPPPPGRGSDSPKNLKSEISDRKSEIQDPRSKI